MKNLFKKGAGSLVLAATAMGVGGAAITASAPSAHAIGIHNYTHYSAYYKNSAECNKYLNGVKATIRSKGGIVTWSRSCYQIPGLPNWSYQQINYVGFGKAIAGDYQH